MKPVRVAPSLLSCDFGRLAEEVRAAEAAGADLLHLDVMDGTFVPNLTIGPAIVKAVRKATGLPLDVHLMIERPERHIDAFAGAGADLISVHAEACPHLHRVLQQIRTAGALPAVALNPHTPESVVDYVLGDCAMVLLMTVNPGFGGQAYIPEVARKVAALRAIIRERSLDVALEVDGGIGPGTAEAVGRAGADTIVAGTAVFGAPDYREAIAAIRTGVLRGRGEAA